MLLPGRPGTAPAGSGKRGAPRTAEQDAAATRPSSADGNPRGSHSMFDGPSAARQQRRDSEAAAAAVASAPYDYQEAVEGSSTTGGSESMANRSLEASSSSDVAYSESLSFDSLNAIDPQRAADGPWSTAPRDNASSGGGGKRLTIPFESFKKQNGYLLFLPTHGRSSVFAGGGRSRPAAYRSDDGFSTGSDTDETDGSGMDMLAAQYNEEIRQNETVVYEMKTILTTLIEIGQMLKREQTTTGPSLSRVVALRSVGFPIVTC